MFIYMIIPFSNRGKKRVWEGSQFVALRDTTIRIGTTPHKSKAIYSTISTLQYIATNQKKKNLLKEVKKCIFCSLNNKIP